MERTALFVDLTNFYSRLIKSGLAQPTILRDYFTDWFDFDTLSKAITGQATNIWVFYSGGRIGTAEARIDKKRLESFIHRVNQLEGVTARDVNIPGEQREHLIGKCEHCGQDVSMEWRSEKGIDSSLTVHLFDTMDIWDTAYLLSGDADFVPVVASLRRRGKRIIGAGFPDAAAALIRECYHYIDLSERFLMADIEAYKLLGKQGLAFSWFTNAKPLAEESPDLLELWANWTDRDENDPESGILVLSAKGSYDINDFRNSIKHLKIPRRVSYRIGSPYKRIYFYIPRYCINSSVRHSFLSVDPVTTSMQIDSENRLNYTIKKYDPITGVYKNEDVKDYKHLFPDVKTDDFEDEYFDEGYFIDDND